MTMNSPDGLTELYNLATAGSKDKKQSVETAELMREIGLKCIGFNGVCAPKFYPNFARYLTRDTGPSNNQLSWCLPSKFTKGNCVIAIYKVYSVCRCPYFWLGCTLTSHRVASTNNINDIINRGQSLWASIYRPFDEKLFSKLADSHPDLPVFILNHEYGALFADPPVLGHETGAKVGRVLTSIVAVACLRAQTGVGPQVLSHVFGLRKAYEDESFKASGEFPVEGGEWLASDEGNLWLLGAVDKIVEALGEGKGSSFAPGIEKAKL
jgi:hypothetical protein